MERETQAAEEKLDREAIEEWTRIFIEETRERFLETPDELGQLPDFVAAPWPYEQTDRD
jgi:hypothetical protein